MVKRNLMLPDVLFDEFGDNAGGTLGRMSAVSDATVTTNGYVCGWRFRVPQIGEDFAILDGEDEGSGPEIGKFVRILTPGLYISQASISPSGSPNTRGGIFHPDFSDPEVQAHTEPAPGAWYGPVGHAGDTVGVTTLYYWTGPGNYIYDVFSDDPETTINGSAGVDMYRLY